MDAVNIEVTNTESFAYAQDITDWAALYSLRAGKFRAQMRSDPTQPTALYEWSTDNGGILYTETSAAGSIAFTANPVAGTYVQIGTSLVTFVASGATGLQVNIGGSLSATLASLLALLAASADSQISLCTYSVSGNTTLNVTAAQTGFLGNQIGIATNVAGATASGASLSGAAHVVTMVAPLGATEDFVGTYSYDCRFELSGLLFVDLFGGSLIFDQGVTRQATDATILIENIPVATSLAMTPSLLNALIFG